MDWIAPITIFLANAGLIVWFRTESRNDWRQMDVKLDTMRTDFHNETKDFHARLCILEERYLQIITKK